jgi:hypothetical protein
MPKDIEFIFQTLSYPFLFREKGAPSSISYSSGKEFSFSKLIPSPEKKGLFGAVLGRCNKPYL